MRYAEYAPALELRPFVDRYWSLADERPVEAEPQIVLPDGHPEWVIHLAVPFDGQAASLYIGQMTAPVQLHARGPVSVFGVRFRPEGAWAFCGDSQDKFRDRISCLNTVVPQARQWREVAGNIDPVAATNTFLLALLRAEAADTRVSGAVGMLLSGSRLTDAATSCGWSVRQLERLVRERTGLSPKTLARLGRFQRALQQRHQGGAWIDIAAECGYTDQSHLVRDFRHFAGRAPSLLQPTGMTAAMVR